jgi:hypothetical protein
METQYLLTTKTMPTQPVNDHTASAHFTTMTKPSEILFDEKPKNWPEFEHHLLNEAENPTIGWNQELLNFQLMDTTTKPFNFREGYFNIPDTMIGALQDDLQCSQQEYLMKPASQLYRLHSLKTKLKTVLHWISLATSKIHANWPQQQRWMHLFRQDCLTHLPRQSHTPSQI